MSLPNKSYSTLKGSGFDWLGQVPTDWEGTTIRALTILTNRRNHPDLPLLSVYRDYGVILKSSRDDNRNPAGKDLTAYKLVEPGDLVLNKMKTWQGSLGVSPHRGIVSPAYIICKLKRGLNPRYVHYLLRSNPYIFEYNRISYGVRLGQWDMRYEEFKKLPVYLPSFDEQTGIVRFLDHELGRLDQVIASYRKLVGSSISVSEKRTALLFQYRSSIISEVVTGRVDVRDIAAILPHNTAEEGTGGAVILNAAEADESEDEATNQ